MEKFERNHFFRDEKMNNVELVTEVEELDEISGGGWTWNLAWSSIPSIVIGNSGYVCTWTYECQKNCK